MLEKYQFLPIRAFAIFILTLSLLSVPYYFFVFYYYAACWGLPDSTTLFEWMAFLLIPTVFSIWGIVRTISLSKFDTKLTRVIFLTVIGWVAWYPFVMDLEHPPPSLCWGCHTLISCWP
jgi:hypothetical protein